VFRLMPIEEFARVPRGASPSADAEIQDDLGGFMKTLKLPVEVARFEYPRQCRIRRVRVVAPPDHTPAPAPGPVIVSRQALGDMRQTR
jgi:hypothetical protein